MSRRLDKAPSSSSSLPKPAPENIATREYYGTIPTDEPDADIDFPVRLQSPKRAPEETEQGKAEQGQTEQAARETAHSPSSSEILLQSDLQDQIALGEVDRGMREKGRTGKERKEALLTLRSELEAQREGVRRMEEGRESQEAQTRSE